MSNSNLLVSVDSSNTGENMNPANTYRWCSVYAHGNFEFDYQFDIVLFNHEMPTEEGYLIATADNNKTVLVHLVAGENGIMQGRCCYIDDYEALIHINSPQDWA